MKQELRAVRDAVAQGQPLPIIETTRLELAGYDVGALERRWMDLHRVEQHMVPA